MPGPGYAQVVKGAWLGVRVQAFPYSLSMFVLK
jgi:hypothetical protein